jgi:hypothetical protein
MMKRQRKEKKVRRKQRNREEVARIRRKEVTAEVFLETMQRRVAGDERRDAEEVRRTERRMRRKAAWMEKKREVRAAAAKRKREVAREGGPTRRGKAGAKENNIEAADGTLGRVAALERKLEEQVRGEKKRVEEDYGEGMENQGRKSLLIVEEIRERTVA